MPTDSFTTTTTTGWGGRIRNALGGIVFGLALFVGAFVLLWWNEGRAVHRAEGLKQGLAATVTVNPAAIDASANGQPVHLSGLATTDETLTDPLFGLSRNAIKLNRVVEMYQWEEDEETETRENMGGSQTTETTYTYRKVWREGRIDSSRFERPSGHENPEPPFTSNTIVARDVAVGAYRLDAGLLAKMNRETPIPVTDQLVAEMSAGARRAVTARFGDWLYQADYSGSPQIGDIRIRFETVEPAEISLVALQQSDGRLAPYRAPNGESIALLEYGLLSKEEVFQREQDRNTLMTWLIRGGGFIMMWVGLGLIFGVLRILAAVIPLLGQLVGAGVMLITGIVSFSLSFITIALAWITYRPLIGVPLLVIGIGALGFLFVARRRVAQNAA